MKRRKNWAVGMMGAFLLALWTSSAEQERQFLAAEQAALELQQRQMAPETSLYAGILADVRNSGLAEVVENKEYFVAAAERTERQQAQQRVYSFLQGPKSWNEGRTWAGEWSGKYVKGNYFGNFGCGLCCMANIYSSLTDYSCSPWDMFEYARQVSGYYPTRKVGAIGWADMKVTLRKSGFDSSLENKPETYEEFQKQIAEAKTAVVLVSSRDDDTYWEKTGGHYVNVWLYNEKTDEVFLTDPGVPDHNREWIPLRYVYDALKTISQYQYLLVNDYVEDNNLWKYDGIDDAWVEPNFS